MLGRTALTNKLVSKSTGIEEKKVEGVVNFFFKELENEFRTMNHVFIYLPQLGTFGISQRSIENRIVKMRRIIRHQEYLERIGIYYNKRATMLKGMRTEIFRLFELRRKVRKHRQDNLKLKHYGKSLNGIKGEPLQTTGNQQEAL